MDDPFRLDYNTVHKIAKPPFPYTPGHEMKVIRHHPAPPPPKWHGNGLTYAAAREREHVDILSQCLRHPPTEGTLGNETLHLRITDTIRARDGQCSKLVTVLVLDRDSELSSHEIVAKLYDPLYFNHYQDDCDPFLCADRGYRRESAAYARLSGVDANPEYYGSYSLEIPVDSNQSRMVRLILLQKISGVPMNELRPADFTRAQRQIILKNIIDAESQFYNRDVSHYDMQPRNIIVRSRGSGSSRVDVKVVDFGNAVIGRSLDPEVSRTRRGGEDAAGAVH